ncbi:MAG: hypothetical protein P1U74_07095 [Legionellaceae bacterium]|nr:hypothetical protein [Legionellaceae bacterium]
MKIYCGCSLWLELNQDGLLTSTFTEDQDNAELLKSRLCISVNTPLGIQYFLLSDFIINERKVIGNLDIYLPLGGDLNRINVLVGKIRLNLDGAYQHTLIQEIGVPELRADIYGILPQQLTTLSAINDGKFLKPTTDLHTHFSGAITANMLIEALFKRVELNASASSTSSIPYLSIYLEKVGINVTSLPVALDKSGQIKEGYVDISPLVERDDCLRKFKKLLHIPANKRIIFDQMEEYYCYRGVFIQDVELLEFFLNKLADDYKEQGINYVEISFAKVAKTSYLRVIHEVLPSIEDRTGVKIRFLAMLARTASKEMRELQVQKYEQISLSSPYVVGIDLLSAEINSSYTFYPELKYIASKYPGKVIRVHAGETSYHIENVRSIARLAQKYPDVPFRIGHGTYGVSVEAITDLQRCKNIIIEVNMVSNVALNMHDCQEDHPIDDYIKAKIPVVLGSDGHGLYQSRGIDLVKLLTYRYSSEELVEFVHDLHVQERKHIDYIDKVFIYALLPKLKKFQYLLSSEDVRTDDYINILDQLRLINYNDIDIHSLNSRVFILNLYHKITQNKLLHSFFIDNVILGEDVRTSYRRIADEKKTLDMQAKNYYKNISRGVDKKINKSFGFLPEHDVASNFSVVPTTNSFNLAKTPIMLTGFIPSSLDTSYVAIDKIRDVIASIKTLLEILSCEDYYFVTTGMDIGVQKVVHHLVDEYNKTPSSQGCFELIAYVPNNVKVEDLSSSLTNIIVLDDINSIYKIYKYFMKLAVEKSLISIHFGDGMWNRDLSHAISEVLEESGNLGKESRSARLTRVFSDHKDCVAESKTIDVIVKSLGDICTSSYEHLYVDFLHNTNAIPDDIVIAMYGRFHPSSVEEMVAMVFLSLDTKPMEEISFTKEQQDSAIVALTTCFRMLYSGFVHWSSHKGLVVKHIQSALLLTQPIQEILISMTLEIWQGSVKGISDKNVSSSLDRQGEVVRDNLLPHAYHRRSSFFNSKGYNIYNIPLGDKAAFRLSREGASRRNLTDIEELAIQAVLEEQLRKRKFKKSIELKYTTILILDGKNTFDGKEKAYINDCMRLLSYLNRLYIRSRDYTDLKSMIFYNIKSTDLQQHFSDFLMNITNVYNEIELIDNGYFDLKTIHSILDAFVQNCTGEYTFEAIRDFLNDLEVSQQELVANHMQYFEEHVLKYIEAHMNSENEYSVKSTYIASRLLKTGICFDNIQNDLVSNGFSYKALSHGEPGTLGFYYNDEKVLDVFWGDDRFYPTRVVNDVQIYKKHRVLDDSPWGSRNDLIESDFEYILDKRDNFVRRYTYRFIRPTERMHLVKMSSDAITPKEASSSFTSIEGNIDSKKYFVPHLNKTNDEMLQNALAEELGELSLNRMGTYRFVTSGQSGFKYDVRANNDTLFLRHASLFVPIESSKSRYWQGGGVIKIDLTKVDKNDIRCQYKTKSRANMDQNKSVLSGVYNKKTITGSEHPFDEKLAVELESQLNKARRSAIRNRETHLSKVPLDAVVGWKPYPQYPVWMQREDITMPIILIGSSYLSEYPTFESDGYLKMDDKTFQPSWYLAREIDSYPIDRGYGYFINCLKHKLGPSFNEDILSSIVINTNYAKKYIDKKSNESIDSLARVIFEHIMTKVGQCSVLLDVKSLNYIIDKSLTSWEIRSDNYHIYSSTISMAFYMTPENTVVSNKHSSDDCEDCKLT